MTAALATGSVEPDGIPAWTFTDDPAAPCGLCVVWVEDDDDPFGKWAVPVLPDGPVDRLYRFTHPTCQASAIAYSMEPDR